MARARGTTTQRGYGVAHQAERARWMPIVNAGGAVCWRCKRAIRPGTAWDLGHNDDRTAWLGPEHMKCNRSAAARKKNRLRAVRLGQKARPESLPGRRRSSRNW